MELIENSGYKFTIGCTTYNRKDLIIKCLNSLLAMDKLGSLEEIIIGKS